MMTKQDPLRVDIMLGTRLQNEGPAYTLARLAETMNSPQVACEIFAYVNIWRGRQPGVRIVEGLPSPGPMKKLPFSYTQKFAGWLAERKLYNQAVRRRGPHVVMTWGSVSLPLVAKLKRANVPVVREKYNCTQACARSILDVAYGALGVAPRHGITDQSVAIENEGLRLADAVFCPSPMVRQSLLDLGIPDERLIATSYGWEPERIDGSRALIDKAEGITLLFVGYFCVRKGAHILLEAWRTARIKGRLLIAGAIEPLIAERYADILARPDVIRVPYTPDVGAVYRSADWFIFPTLEEGGPQVTYEAAGAGLPLIVSRMGAGAFMRPGMDGILVEGTESKRWAAEIASLPRREEERRALAAAASARARDFTWNKVGAKRADSLLQRFAT